MSVNIQCNIKTNDNYVKGDLQVMQAIKTSNLSFSPSLLEVQCKTYLTPNINAFTIHNISDNVNGHFAYYMLCTNTFSQT